MALTLRQLNHRRIDWMKAKALQVNLKLFDHPTPKKQEIHLDLKKIKKILCLRLDDKLGDMVVSSILYREIKLANPHIQIDIMSGPTSLELLENNPYIHNRISFKKGTFNVLKLGRLIRKEMYDLIIDVRPLIDARTTYLLAQTKAPWILGASRQKLHLMNLHLEEFEKNNHISHKYEKILNLIGLIPQNLNYDLFLAKEELQKVKNLIPSNPKTIVLNPYAGARYRSLNPQKTIEVINETLKFYHNKSVQIILMCPPQERRGIQNLIAENDWKNVLLLEKLTSIRDYAALIYWSDLVVTPDTSAVHIASAFQKKIIAFYRYDLDAPEINSQVWAPNSPQFQIIYARGYNAENSEIDMSTFDIHEYHKALESLSLL